MASSDPGISDSAACTTSEAVALAVAMALHRPKAFVAAAQRFDWFPECVLRELIQLIASYACTPGMPAPTFSAPA